jgi:hypothetical protein
MGRIMLETSNTEYKRCNTQLNKAERIAHERGLDLRYDVNGNLVITDLKGNIINEAMSLIGNICDDEVDVFNFIRKGKGNGSPCYCDAYMRSLGRTDFE